MSAECPHYIPERLQNAVAWLVVWEVESDAICIASIVYSLTVDDIQLVKAMAATVRGALSSASFAENAVAALQSFQTPLPMTHD